MRQQLIKQNFYYGALVMKNEKLESNPKSKLY